MCVIGLAVWTELVGYISVLGKGLLLLPIYSHPTFPRPDQLFITAMDRMLGNCSGSEATCPTIWETASQFWDPRFPVKEGLDSWDLPFDFYVGQQSFQGNTHREDHG